MSNTEPGSRGAPSGEPAPWSTQDPGRKKGCGGACFNALVILFVLAGLGVLTTYYGPPIIGDFFQYRLAKFQQSLVKKSIQETFREETQRIASTNGNILELATKESAETFDRRTELLVGGVKVPFFDNTASLKTKATFRYHLKLDGPWELRREAENSPTLIVVSPKIEATLPVAFDSDAMESQLKGYWIARHHQGESLDELRHGLTQRLEQRAVSKESIQSVREASRTSVAMFVKNWLVKEDEWRAEGFTGIKVIFPDEEQKDTDKLPETLKLDTAEAPAAQ